MCCLRQVFFKIVDDIYNNRTLRSDVLDNFLYVPFGTAIPFDIDEEDNDFEEIDEDLEQYEAQYDTESDKD